MHTTEWAAFRLQAGATVEALRQASQQMQAQFLDAQPGFVSRQLLDLGEGGFADLVVWASAQAAKEMMDKAPQHPACQAYFALMQVDQSPSIGVVVEQNGKPPHEPAARELQPGGLEFSRFRALPGVRDSQLVAAAAKMSNSLYLGEPGYQGHFLVRNDSAEYADVVLADTAARARSLCERWGTGPYHPACEDYLALIDPQSVQLDFWQRVS